MKINTVVIIYNAALKESETLNSILCADMSDIELTINIWNNGPNLLKNNDIEECREIFSKKNIIINIYEDIRNVGLSKIYNYLLSKGEYEYFSIFDQDSHLDVNFFRNIVTNSTYDLIVPQVFSFDEENKHYNQIFPTYIGNPDPIKLGDFVVKDAFAISSGLSISHRLVTKMNDFIGPLFDERFAFYGVDGCFFMNVKSLIETHQQKIAGLCIGQMKHSIAMLSQEKMSDARLTEVWYERVLHRTICHNKPKFKTFIILVKKFLKGTYSFSILRKLIICLIKGQHPRAIYDINVDKNQTK